MSRSGTHGKRAPELAIPLTLSCPVSGFCLAGDDQGRVMGLQGGVWSRPTSVAHEGLDDVSCAGPTFCVAIDVSGNAYVFNGSTWDGGALVTRPLGLSGTSVSDILSCAPVGTFCLV